MVIGRTNIESQDTVSLHGMGSEVVQREVHAGER